MKNRHTPLVELLIGVYDLLAVDDTATIDCCDHPVARLRLAMKRMEKYYGVPCKAAASYWAKKKLHGCPSDRKNAEGE